VAGKASGPFTAKLINWSDEDAAVRSFDRLVDAIRWLAQAQQDGARAQRASIYSADNKLVWSLARPPRSDDMRENVFKRNAERILFQSGVVAQNVQSPPGPPMDLANMRQNGVRALLVSCLDCLHDATVNVDNQPGHLAVKSFEARMVCGTCGSRRIHVRPAWHTRPTYIPPT
jgi:hypothetical protein